MVDNKTIGERLKHVRELINVNPSQFAKQAGVDISQYNKAEKGEKGLGSKKFLDLCSKWNLNPDYILTGKGSMFADTLQDSGRQSFIPAADLPADTKALYERWLSDKDKTQQQFHATNLGLIELLKNKLDEIAANLMTGQTQLKEQLFVVGEGLEQQLEGIASGLAAREKKSAKKDTNVSARQRNGDGKGKSH